MALERQEEVLDLVEMASEEVVVEEIAYRGRYLHFRSVCVRRMKVVMVKAV